MEKPSAHQSIGVECLPLLFRAVAIEIKEKQLHVNDVFEIPLKTADSGDEDVKPLYMTEKNEKLTHWLDKDLVVSVLSGESVLIRSMEIKLTKQKEIDQVLYFQAEPLLPFPIDGAVVDRIVVARDKEGTTLTLLAAPGEQIQDHLDELSQLEIDPEVVTSEQAALSSYMQAVVDPQEASKVAQVLIYLGPHHTVCVLNKKGKLAAAQTIPLGCEGLKHGAYSAEQEVNHEFKESFDALRFEITRVVYSLGKQLKGDELSGILVTGEGANCGTLGQELVANLQKPLLVAKHIEGVTQEQQNTFAVPLGAALTALNNYKDQVNFRQKAYSFQNPLRRYRKSLIGYGLIALGLAAAAYFSGMQYLGYQEDKIRESYAHLLGEIKRPFNEMEGMYLKKDPADPTLITNAKNLTVYEISNRLQFLEKEIESTPAIFPLFPNVPRVSDFLAWLVNHPNVVLKQPGKAEPQGLIQIESINYSMIKRPDMTKKAEKYQIKVELELSANSPKEAREFHDALISPNDMIDPKAEVKWNATKGRYKTSFSLKDRTSYPATNL